MVDYDNIRNTLDRLVTKYDEIEDDEYIEGGICFATLYSKLALLEFCGWMEEAFDKVLKDYITHEITDTNCRNVAKEIIKRNYGFKFQNIVKLFCCIIGFKNWENIQSNINNDGYLEIFMTTLNDNSKKRDTAAHTNTIGVTEIYNSPTITLHNYDKFEVIMRMIEEDVQKIKSI